MTPASAPGSAAASHAPTPVSTSFANKDAGDQATPTSATTSKGAGPKKSKKAGAAGNDDSDAEVREPKKVRTNFGAGRK
jgi:chromatin modification-related protein EAF6